jgi:hypothetical protein
MDIVKEKYERKNDILKRIEVPHKFFLFRVICFVSRFLFEAIHYKHYKEKEMKTIQINGIRKALIETKNGTRERVNFM